jgi:lipoate-protein ligase B
MIQTIWLGRQPYQKTLNLQEEQRKKLIANPGNEKIFVLEHDHVITKGKRAVILEDEKIGKKGIPIVETNRGGLATYHGPGQLIVYPIINIRRRKIRIREWVYLLEEAAITILRELNIETARRCEFPGVWVGNSKICSIGLQIRHGISTHGMALNVDPDLNYFSLFEPCGIPNGRLCSISQFNSSQQSIESLGLKLGKEVAKCVEKFDDNIGKN